MTAKKGLRTSLPAFGGAAGGDQGRNELVEMIKSDLKMSSYL